MFPTIKIKSFITYSKYNHQKINEGDIIVFKRILRGAIIYIIHRVFKIYTVNNNFYYLEKGDYAIVPEIIEKKSVIGVSPYVISPRRYDPSRLKNYKDKKVSLYWNIVLFFIPLIAILCSKFRKEEMFIRLLRECIFIFSIPLKIWYKTKNIHVATIKIINKIRSESVSI